MELHQTPTGPVLFELTSVTLYGSPVAQVIVMALRTGTLDKVSSGWQALTWGACLTATASWANMKRSTSGARAGLHCMLTKVGRSQLQEARLLFPHCVAISAEELVYFMNEHDFDKSMVSLDKHRYANEANLCKNKANLGTTADGMEGLFPWSQPTYTSPTT